MISDNKMMKRWTLYVVMISLTMASGRCNDECNSPVVFKQLLGEYQSITSKTVKLLPDLKHTTLNDNFNAPSINNISNIAIQNLSATCRRHVDTLAFKDQFQKQIFNNNTTLSSDDILLLTSLIINLQTAAIKLQDIEKELNKRYCIEFTSEQYELIYFSRLHIKNKSLVCSLIAVAGKKWQDKTDVCGERWKEYNLKDLKCSD